MFHEQMEAAFQGVILQYILFYQPARTMYVSFPRRTAKSTFFIEFRGPFRNTPMPEGSGGETSQLSKRSEKKLETLCRMLIEIN